MVRSLEPCVPNYVCGPTIEKPSTRRCAQTLFQGIFTHDIKNIEFQIFYELKIKNYSFYISKIE